MSIQNQSDCQNAPRTVEDIIRAIEEKTADGDYIFRGESRCHEVVSSGLYRKLEKVRMLNLGVETFQDQELKYVKRYRYTQKTDESEILTELQHFGGKTNLIDFTTNPHIALFFACEKSHHEDGRIISQDKNGAIKDCIIKPCDPDPKSRVNVQKSIFIKPPEGFIEVDKKIIIPGYLKQPMLNYLKKTEIGISAEIIYPDLHGFVSSQDNRWNVYEEIDKGNEYLKSVKETETPKEKSKNQKAVQHFTNAIDNATQIQLPQAIAEAHLWRGCAYFAEYELDNSAANFENAIADFSKAIELIQEVVNANSSRSIELIQRFAEAYNRRGLAGFSKGNLENSKVDFNNAIADFSKAIELNSEFARAHYNRGRAHFLLGEFALAIQDYSTAIDLKPDRDIYYDRGVAWLHQQEWEKAKADLIGARSMEFNIIAAFQDFYKNVEKCEQLIGAKLPPNIASLLTQP